MAKKRKRSHAAQGTPKPSLWTAQEKATLYGWLDYCAKVVEYDKNDFLSTVSFKLEDEGIQSHDIRRITDKLRRDWNSYGMANTTFDDIFKIGAAIFERFSDQQKEDIAIAKERFIRDNMSTTPARRLRRDRASTQMRSMSRTPAQSSQNGTPSLIKRERESKHHGSPALRTYGKDRRRKVDQAPKVADSGKTQSKNSAFTKPLRVNLRSEFDPPRSPSKKSLRAHIPSPTISVVKDSEDGEDDISAHGVQSTGGDHGAVGEPDRDNPDKSFFNTLIKLSPAFERQQFCISDCLFKQNFEGLKPGEIMCSKCRNWQHYSCIGVEIGKAQIPDLGRQPYHCDNCNSISHQQWISYATNTSGITESLRYKLETALLEISSLKEKLFQKESDFEEYRTEARRIEDFSRHQNSVQDRIDHIYQGGNSSQSVETLLQEREEHIKKLEKKLSDRRSLGRFARLSRDDREAFGIEVSSHEGISKVYDTAKQFALQFEPPRQHPLPKLDQHPELKILISSGLRLEGNGGEYSHLFKSLNTQEVLRSLVTSGLFHWVFSTAFPIFAGREDAFLMKYRECLLQQDGPTTVRNLDLACYHSIIRGTTFHQKYIIPEAEKLAVRFSRALAPLFSETPNSATESNWDGFSTWGETPEKWAERRSWLFELFQQALELKAESCLNTEEYEMVIYQSGTKYDENYMSVETEDGMAVSSIQHGESVVKVCVEAAVFSFAKAKVLDEGSLGPEMLSSNFIQRNREQRLASQVLLRAVVILA